MLSQYTRQRILREAEEKALKTSSAVKVEEIKVEVEKSETVEDNEKSETRGRKKTDAEKLKKER